MRSKFNNFYEKCEKTVETSNKIEELYQELADIEFRYGKCSNEYLMLSKIIQSISSKENNDLKYMISSPYIEYFERYIQLSGCERLIDKIKISFDVSDKLNKKNYDDFELANHKKCKNIFNLIQSKTYIKVLDLYIDKEKNKEVKRLLIDEKYDIIERNNLLESWYFGFDNVCLLVESDYLSSQEVLMNENDYVKCKNSYYTSVFSRFLDSIYSSDLDAFDKAIFETNMISLLLCMNNEYTFNNLCEMKDDIRKSIASKATKRFVNNIHSKYLSLEKNLKVKYINEEEI